MCAVSCVWGTFYDHGMVCVDRLMVGPETGCFVTRHNEDSRGSVTELDRGPGRGAGAGESELMHPQRNLFCVATNLPSP